MLVLAASGTAQAFEIDTGDPDFAVRWDNTVKYNYANRVESQDRHILATRNNDDGDRNFDKGTVSNRVDLLSEFDFIYQKRYGFRVSGAAWYDHAYGDLDNQSIATSNHLVNFRPALGLGSVSKRYHKGTSGEILDAFVFGKWDLDEMQLNLKFGRHTVFWGESALTPVHGVGYGQAPIDQRKASTVPGTEAKELLLPRFALSAQLQAQPDLSFAAQYFLDWDPARLPEAGSYLGANDPLWAGGESQQITATTRYVRGEDLTPRKRGDYGLAARWSPEWLDGTLGFYYRNTSDLMPQAHLRPGFAPVGAGACGAVRWTVVGAGQCANLSINTVPQLQAGVRGQYHLVYADDIDILGLSLSKNIGGVSVGVDLSYRHDMPLVSDVVMVAPAAFIAAKLTTPGAVTALPSDGNTAGARGDTWHGVVNGLGTIGDTPVFDAASWLVELQWNHWSKVSQGELVFKGRDNYRLLDRVTKNFYGIGVNFTPTWFQVFPGVDLSAPVSVSGGLSGNSAVTGGGNEGGGNYSIGLGAELYAKYRFDLKYVDFFGDYRTHPTTGAITENGGTNAYLKDRGFVSFTFKTTF